MNGGVEMSVHTDPAQLRPLLNAGYQLIPLHNYSREDGRKGKRRKRGKSPVDANWTKRPYRSDDQVLHMEAGDNVGVRLRSTDLIIDVDPRNFEDVWQGVDPFTELVLRLGIDPDEFPTVRTGSGGLHLYMTKAETASVSGSLPDFPGVEFKSMGFQVVAPGSIHPDSQETYQWMPGEALDEFDWLGAPAAPEELLALIQRPAGALATGGGEHDQEALAHMLGHLPPEAFRDHEAWLTLMQACHHATAGDGRQEFIDWCTSDPGYADHGNLIGVRWDSLHSDNGGSRVTTRTLYKIMQDHGVGDAIPTPCAADDFPDEENEDSNLQATEAAEDDKTGNPIDVLIEEMNEEFCAVLDGGVFQIFREDHDPAFKHRRVWARMSREAFRHYFEDETVTPFGSKKPISKADLWLSSRKRRKYPGIVMDPEGLPENEGKLNLWTGWSVEPQQGDWSMMQELIGEVLCDGNSEADEYVKRWIAYMLQRPWETPEAAIAFRGEEGTGKGTLGRALMRIAGPHGLTVSSSRQFAGRFNDHLRDCVFLFADEAVWPGDKEGEGVLKQLITEPVISYEGKNKGIVAGRNMVHLMMASNEDWVVPAGPEARRYFVSDVSDRRKRDQAFFGRLWRQMDNGGLAGMVHDLQVMDLTGWRPAMNIPQTRALADQKLRSMKPADRFWFELLNEGALPISFTADCEEVDWRSGPVELGPADRDRTVAAFDLFLRKNQLRSERATHRALVNAGRKLIGLSTARASGGTERTWLIPSLVEARAVFEQRSGASDLFD